MFKSKLKYYHGTSTKKWSTIEIEGKFKPAQEKKVSDYWITKGIYFVCENPYIALWYAHVAALKDASKPIVLCIEYEIGGEDTSKIINLLTSDGHKLLTTAHHLHKEKLGLKNDSSSFDDNDDSSINLDSLALQLFMSKTSTKGVIASFQEGKSFQKMITGKGYENKHVPTQKGFCPGDHVEICFYPDLDIKGLGIKTFTKGDIVTTSEQAFWDMVCTSLSSSLPDKFGENVLKFCLN
ncbi:MAG: hypothetical protein LBM67_01370 [Lentimicrobiaceae bacterium]|jgi:hypothetical protein|nr:hypothetical protein [Lentimicrobiaceae bacterium]